MDDSKKYTKGFNLKEVILIIIATALLTSITTGVIIYNQNKLTKNITYKDLNKDTALKEFLSVYASLIDEYYEDVDKTAMLESAIAAMFKYLGEDYSTYMSKEETEALANRLKGEYKGIGITINSENVLVDVFLDGPASSAGLLSGDKVIAVDGKIVSQSSEITEIISSKSIGEKIRISVSRGDANLNFDVEVKKLYIPAVNYEMYENNIGYLKITTFSNTLKQQVSKALNDLESKGMQSLIIDLRDNSGGYLSAAKDVASIFLKKDDIIYSLEEKDETTIVKDETNEAKNYKIVVLFNGASASSSEVLIAALKDSYGATTVGVTSYGKGKVQQTHSLEDGSMVKYTSAKWLTPKGECIDEIGITPEYYVTFNPDTNIDEQLEKALELAK